MVDIRNLIFNKKGTTVGEVTGGREGNIIINYTKMNERIKKCKEEKNNTECRIKLKELGIEFMDD